jgi:hypothetical protein
MYNNVSYLIFHRHLNKIFTYTATLVAMKRTNENSFPALQTCNYVFLPAKAAFKLTIYLCFEYFSSFRTYLHTLYSRFNARLIIRETLEGFFRTMCSTSRLFS